MICTVTLPHAVVSRIEVYLPGGSFSITNHAREWLTNDPWKNYDINVASCGQKGGYIESYTKKWKISGQTHVFVLVGVARNSSQASTIQLYYWTHLVLVVQWLIITLKHNSIAIFIAAGQWSLTRLHFKDGSAAHFDVLCDRDAYYIIITMRLVKGCNMRAFR
jgi:hypothetical protein